MSDQEETKEVQPPAGNEQPKEDKAQVEKEQEAKLKAKYPMLKGGPGGRQAFLQNRIISRGQKYFDSGDYALAKAKIGPASKKPVNAGGKFLIADGTSHGQHPTPESVHVIKASMHAKSKLAASNDL